MKTRRTEHELFYDMEDYLNNYIESETDSETDSDWENQVERQIDKWEDRMSRMKSKRDKEYLQIEAKYDYFNKLLQHIDKFCSEIRTDMSDKFTYIFDKNDDDDEDGEGVDMNGYSFIEDSDNEGLLLSSDDDEQLFTSSYIHYVACP